MFKYIAKLVQRFRNDRTGLEELADQVERAEFLRDLIGVARKTGRDVVMTIEVGVVRQGVIIAGNGDVSRWLYDFACSEVMCKRSRLDDAREELRERGLGG